MIVEHTPYGFTYGPAKVERWIGCDPKGWVVIGITTKNTRMVFRCTSPKPARSECVAAKGSGSYEISFLSNY